MAPTEETILASFLLLPAPLNNFISGRSFNALFPSSQRSNPRIRALYRDLQHQRALITDAVARNITIEVKRGHAQRRAIAKARRRAEREEQDDEVDIENTLFGVSSNLPIQRPHSLATIIAELEQAATAMTDEIRQLEEEAETLLNEINSTVDSMSDLRYGRLTNAQLREEVLDGLSRMDSVLQKR